MPSCKRNHDDGEMELPSEAKSKRFGDGTRVVSQDFGKSGLLVVGSTTINSASVQSKIVENEPAPLTIAHQDDLPSNGANTTALSQNDSVWFPLIQWQSQEVIAWPKPKQQPSSPIISSNRHGREGMAAARRRNLVRSLALDDSLCAMDSVSTAK